MIARLRAANHSQPTDRDRPIRSFVLRQGRITRAQLRAFDAHWPRFGLEVDGATHDFDVVFGRRAPRVLEIGFGNGEALLWSATADPQRDFLGIEVHRPGVGRMLNALARSEIENVRLFQHDAVETLNTAFSASSLDEIRIWFPDPWHKTRHHKRRLIQPPFVAILCSRLCPGGRLHLATDWADYARQMRDVLDACTGLRSAAGPRAALPRPACRPPTHFEQRGLRLGHSVFDLLYERR